MTDAGAARTKKVTYWYTRYKDKGYHESDIGIVEVE
jgi:hypothetical protein